mmetsp:Transcript_53706/g.123534  ORF Transcript_53706/g.123534 Transcript_53706/m.123534 type:complete len:203 (+) Transcript_53706:230-838(+)
MMAVAAAARRRGKTLCMANAKKKKTKMGVVLPSLPRREGVSGPLIPPYCHCRKVFITASRRPSTSRMKPRAALRLKTPARSSGRLWRHWAVYSACISSREAKHVRQPLLVLFVSTRPVSDFFATQPSRLRHCRCRMKPKCPVCGLRLNGIPGVAGHSSASSRWHQPLCGKVEWGVFQVPCVVGRTIVLTTYFACGWPKLPTG